MKTVFATLGCLLWGACLTVRAQEQQPSGLEALEKKFQAEMEAKVKKPHQQRVDELNKNYKASLDRARESAQQRNGLDEALALSEESERITKSGAVPAEDDAKTPTSLKNLRAIYRQAISKAESERAARIRPVLDSHIAALNAMIGQLTREGKLAEAKAARDSMEKLKREYPAGPARNVPLGEFLAGTTWLWYGKEGGAMTFSSDGTIEFPEWTNKGLVTGWKVTGKNSVRLTILKGREHWPNARLEFADDRSSFTGTDFNGEAQIAKSPRVP